MVLHSKTSVTRVEKLPLTNEQIGTLLEETAERLEAQGANPFRVRAYRTASKTLKGSKQQVSQLLQEHGVNRLIEFRGIGQPLARAIEHLAFTGELPLLTRLRGDVTAERLFATVPGIGPLLARRIHVQLDIETLAELESAAYDGRLASVEGMGSGRIRAVRESLAGRFRQHPRIRESQPESFHSQEPPVAELLNIDHEYRQKAAIDCLPRIAPKRFNPTRAAWLPILHTQRNERHYTALFSNTVRAHAVGTTHDWVVIYRDDQKGDGQWTVVTSRFGPLKNKRIVRGREEECKQHYLQAKRG